MLNEAAAGQALGSDRSPIEQPIGWYSKLAIAAFPVVPHLVLDRSPLSAAVLGVVSYVPIIITILRITTSLYTAALLGALHGAALVAIAAWWVWTFATVPAILAGLAVMLVGAYYALVFTLIRASVRPLARARTLLQFAALVIIAILLCAAELGRSLFADAFFPLGSLGVALAEPPFLPVAGAGGIAGLVLFAFLLNTAVASLGQPTRRGGVFALALAAVVVVAANLDRSPAEATLRMSTVCAYSDIGRRDRHDEDYARPRWVDERVAAAASAGCELVVFPELTVATTADAVQAPLPPARPAVVLGARIAERFEAGRAVLGPASSNSICSANVALDRVTCTARVDKQFLIPFVEANLFRTIPGLSAVGARVTAWVMGAENPTKAAMTATVLEVEPELSVGVLNCSELFQPVAIQRDANGTRVDPQLLVAAADHSGFPPLRALRVLTRHVARLQAVAAGTPLLLVSTEDAALFSADGEERHPRIHSGDFYLWVL